MATARPNPYAPPNARVADVEPTTHGLKHRGVLMMILFTFLTFGLYILIWWFRRRPGLNRLNSPRKIALWPLLAGVGLYAIQTVAGFIEGASPGALSSSANLSVSIFGLFVGIAFILQAFRAKDIIEDHAAPEPESGPMFRSHVKLSGLMTFFFSIFYLQWAINRYVIDTRS